jgi:hypothetical protein
MTLLLFFILAGIGITSIVADSEFTRGPKEKLAELVKSRCERLGGKTGEEDDLVVFGRKLLYMLYCYQCSGFWVGMALGLFMHPMPEFHGLWRLLEVVGCGGVTSYAAQVGMSLHNYLNVSYGGEK